jgi:hypothetical protein
MKLRHAAAFALVGWYLMLPPTTLNGVDVSVPLSRWRIYQEYNSYRDCVAGWNELQNQTKPDAQIQFPPKEVRQFAAYRCVSSEDSDLKSN